MSSVHNFFSCVWARDAWISIARQLCTCPLSCSICSFIYPACLVIDAKPGSVVIVGEDSFSERREVRAVALPLACGAIPRVPLAHLKHIVRCRLGCFVRLLRLACGRHGQVSWNSRKVTKLCEMEINLFWRPLSNSEISNLFSGFTSVLREIRSIIQRVMLGMGCLTVQALILVTCAGAMHLIWDVQDGTNYIYTYPHWGKFK
jgi:hypothetical protein